ncbi:proline-rich protein 36-like [Triticum dicoccoides]|uniref:proline-rich protein 36-like n=1 Tax=Triticum dicoccoides TaxID=85692 RepID=UPI00188EDA4A|nr:proline-rich protein 36-like [Triticum dicoccoides]
MGLPGPASGPGKPIWAQPASPAPCSRPPAPPRALLLARACIVVPHRAATPPPRRHGLGSVLPSPKSVVSRPIRPPIVGSGKLTPPRVHSGLIPFLLDPAAPPRRRSPPPLLPPSRPLPLASHLLLNFRATPAPPIHLAPPHRADLHLRRHQGPLSRLHLTPWSPRAAAKPVGPPGPASGPGKPIWAQPASPAPLLQAAGASPSAPPRPRLHHRPTPCSDPAAETPWAWICAAVAEVHRQPPGPASPLSDPGSSCRPASILAGSRSSSTPLHLRAAGVRRRCSLYASSMRRARSASVSRQRLRVGRAQPKAQHPAGLPGLLCTDRAIAHGEPAPPFSFLWPSQIQPLVFFCVRCEFVHLT